MKGLLKLGAAASLVVWALVLRARPKLGMPLVRRVVLVEVRLEAGFAGAAAAKGVLERTSDVLDAFFWSGTVGAAGRDSEETDGFLRSCSVEAGARSWEWLPAGLSTGRREAAGLGMPEGRGMLEGAGSMVWLRPLHAG